MRDAFTFTAITALAAVAARTLAGCDVGPGYEPAPGETSSPYPAFVTRGAVTTASAQASSSADASPLLDDDGEPMPSQPAALPPGAKGTGAQRLYATPGQAHALARAPGSIAIHVDLERCGASIRQAAVDAGGPADAGACAMRALSAHPRPGLRGDRALLVHADDLARAEAAVDRLRSAGWRRVWVVNDASGDPPT